jgi:hypothetical protein
MTISRLSVEGFPQPVAAACAADAAGVDDAFGDAGWGAVAAAAGAAWASNRATRLTINTPFA